MRTDHRTRLIKWLGDPPVLRDDYETVANWKYEDARTVAIPGRTERVITRFDRIKTGPGSRQFKDVPNGLSQDYYWHRRTPNFVIEMTAEDAAILLKRQPLEFVDVTNVKLEDIPMIRNVPIYKSKDGKTLPPLPSELQYKEIARVTPNTLVPRNATVVDDYQYAGSPYNYKPVDIPLGAKFDSQGIIVARDELHDYTGT